jgi:hypothetical protein
MTKKLKLEFKDFLSYFPEVELPVTLTDESVYIFSKNNKILPQELIDEFISPRLDHKDPEFREIIPCFIIPKTPEFFALVFWDGGLLTYEYNLVTFDKAGNFISGKVIAGTISNGKTIHRSVATIDPEWMIYIVAGEAKADDIEYNAESSKAFGMEILANGEIIFSLDD